MSNIQQEPLRQPPTLPVHYDQMSPSPTSTVKRQPIDESLKYNNEKTERNEIPELGAQHDLESTGGLVEGRKRKRRMEGRNCCARSGTFVMPTIDIGDITSSPTAGSQITFVGDGLNINFGLVIKVNNPNLLSIDLSDIEAVAFYPNKKGGHTQIGGGYLAQKFIPSRTDLNFTFPFAIQYNPTYDTDQSVLSDLAEKCGLTGGAKSDITIDYTIRFQAKVLVIKVHPTISSSATFACPLDSGAMPGLGDGTITI
ncbi:hypothetical protein HPULCUR_001829 [Helicostylum pulchrum]|uniref:Late embryogenesis abundant protein LEA-2 subgroup domain-containing protein n=1 Tax=Helicostylum pulchrum TaxID=562976 RepID=A0ABP9XNV7_9FUNG